MRASLSLAALLLVSPARAEEPPALPPGATSPIARDSLVDHSYAMVEVGMGALSLPYKKLCIPTQNKCATADFTLLGSLRYSLRWSPHFAAGAGVSLGVRPISDEADLAAPGAPIQRVHSRNYLIISGQLRYYVTQRDGFEVWGGGSGGLIVVSDRYELEDKGTAIINPHSTTLSTQGPMVGLAAGAAWSLNSSWTVGGWTSQMIWFLPDKPACGPTGDCATVSGASYSLELGLALTYRSRI